MRGPVKAGADWALPTRGIPLIKAPPARAEFWRKERREKGDGFIGDGFIGDGFIGDGFMGDEDRGFDGGAYGRRMERSDKGWFRATERSSAAMARWKARSSSRGVRKTHRPNFIVLRKESGLGLVRNGRHVGAGSRP